MCSRVLELFIAAFLFALSSITWAQCSPIVIDINKDGIHLGEGGVGVHFDVNDDGIIDHVQWVRAGGDEAFLTLDRDGSGTIEDGSELFGVGTPLVIEGGTAPNGFVGLAQYDAPALGGNDDGLITDADAIWSSLRLWLDEDADGVSTLAEMLSLESFGFTSLETIPKFDKHYDDAGNIIPYWAWATTSSEPVETRMVDVFFLVLPERTAMCPQRQGQVMRTSAG